MEHVQGDEVMGLGEWPAPPPYDYDSGDDFSDECRCKESLKAATPLVYGVLLSSFSSLIRRTLSLRLRFSVLSRISSRQLPACAFQINKSLSDHWTQERKGLGAPFGRVCVSDPREATRLRGPRHKHVLATISRRLQDFCLDFVTGRTWPNYQWSKRACTRDNTY